MLTPGFGAAGSTWRNDWGAGPNAAPVTRRRTTSSPSPPIPRFVPGRTVLWDGWLRFVSAYRRNLRRFFEFDGTTSHGPRLSRGEDGTIRRPSVADAIERYGITGKPDHGAGMTAL